MLLFACAQSNVSRRLSMYNLSGWMRLILGPSGTRIAQPSTDSLRSLAGSGRSLSTVLPECWSFGHFGASVPCFVNFLRVFHCFGRCDGWSDDLSVRLRVLSGARLSARVLCRPLSIVLPECWSFRQFGASVPCFVDFLRVFFIVLANGGGLMGEMGPYVMCVYGYPQEPHCWPACGVDLYSPCWWNAGHLVLWWAAWWIDWVVHRFGQSDGFCDRWDRMWYAFTATQLLRLDTETGKHVAELFSVLWVQTEVGC